MRYLFYVLQIFLYAVVLGSCEGDINIDCESEIVVEGSIAEGGFPVVFVTTTLPMSTKQGKVPLDSLEHHVLNWAKVEIDDGERSVILTGRVNKRYNIPCYFTTGDMRGEAGKTYRIDVTYGQYHATASTTIPQARPVVDSLTIVPLNTKDSLFSIMAHVPPQHSSGYYQFQVGVEGYDNDLYPSFLGVFTDENIAQGASIPVYRAHDRLKHKDDKFNSNYHRGDKVHIRFAAMEEYAYQFWNAYEVFISMGSNFLFPVNKNLPSNIQGGIGIWYGYTYSAFFLEVP